MWACVVLYSVRIADCSLDTPTDATYFDTIELASLAVNSDDCMTAVKDKFYGNVTEYKSAKITKPTSTGIIDQGGLLCGDMVNTITIGNAELCNTVAEESFMLKRDPFQIDVQTTRHGCIYYQAETDTRSTIAWNVADNINTNTYVPGVAEMCLPSGDHGELYLCYASWPTTDFQFTLVSNTHTCSDGFYMNSKEVLTLEDCLNECIVGECSFVTYYPNYNMGYNNPQECIIFNTDCNSLTENFDVVGVTYTPKIAFTAQGKETDCAGSTETGCNRLNAAVGLEDWNQCAFPDPTVLPTSVPTGLPTPVPTGDPTSVPTGDPTPGPTDDLIPEPTGYPTPGPTGDPTPGPTLLPTLEPECIPILLDDDPAHRSFFDDIKLVGVAATPLECENDAQTMFPTSATGLKYATINDPQKVGILELTCGTNTYKITTPEMCKLIAEKSKMVYIGVVPIAIQENRPAGCSQWRESSIHPDISWNPDATSIIVGKTLCVPQTGELLLCYASFLKYRLGDYQLISETKICTADYASTTVTVSSLDECLEKCKNTRYKPCSSFTYYHGIDLCDLFTTDCWTTSSIRDAQTTPAITYTYNVGSSARWDSDCTGIAENNYEDGTICNRMDAGLTDWTKCELAAVTAAPSPPTNNPTRNPTSAETQPPLTVQPEPDDNGMTVGTLILWVSVVIIGLAIIYISVYKPNAIESILKAIKSKIEKNGSSKKEII